MMTAPPSSKSVPARGSSWRTSVSGRLRGQGRSRRAQRRRQDHPHQDPRWGSTARFGVGANLRRGGVPAARIRASGTPRSSPVTGSCRRAVSTTSYAACRAAETEMGSDDPQVRDRAMKRYTRADAELHAGGGYAAESEAAQIAAQPGHRRPDPRPAAQDSCRRPARRCARILFSAADTLLLDEPAPRRRLDRVAARVPQGPQGRADRDQPRQRPARDDREQGAPPRCQPGEIGGVANMVGAAYLRRRRRRRRKGGGQNAESKAKTLTDQANKMRAKAGQRGLRESMLKRAEKMMAGLEGERRTDKVASLFPAPLPPARPPSPPRSSPSPTAPEVFHLDFVLDRQGQPRRHPRCP